ncbi:ATP synthase F(0) complex subunit B1, mitochondrial-like [Halichondria panicea]|uniref:ATP synthase F(0) complex subunit B1, mitochondrial-like n=1 Tax=Halichondria panicea TaxID=6063 RepID=UPI00312BA2B2
MLPRLGLALGRFTVPSRAALLNGVRPLSATTPPLKPEGNVGIRAGLVEKLGVTGPWTLGVGLGLYVIGKEFYVMNSETVILGVMGGVIYWLMTKVGKPVGEFLDTRSQNILTLLEEGKNKKMSVLETSIQAEKEVEVQLEARHELFEVFKENNDMLIEEEYRRRLHEVTNEVKKRLNYHVEVDATQKAFEHRHMVAWLERQVTEAMKGKQDESLVQCMTDLKRFSTV